MRKFWFLLLPLVHMGLAGVWIAHEHAQLWPYLPRFQASEDFQRTHPPVPESKKSADDVDWDWELSEYRLSVQAIALLTIDPGPAILAGFNFPFRSTQWSSTKIPVLAAISHPLTDHLRLKTRIIVLDGLLLFLVGLQWFLIGRWVDRRASLIKRTSLIRVPPLQISGLALLAQLCMLVHEVALSSTSELIARLCLTAALLVWVWWGVVALWRLGLNLRNRFRSEVVVG